MAFVTPIPITTAKSSTPNITFSNHSFSHVVTPRMSLESKVNQVNPSVISTQIYGSEEDVCTFGAECTLSEECVDASPALDRLMDKYLFPMREDNTQVFFDNHASPDHTLMIVFNPDRHGMVLDVVSVLKALSVRVHRIASSQSDALRLLMPRMERELVSLRDLSISYENCVAFWISDEASGNKIFGDGDRLQQLTTCIKLELETPYPRPKPARQDHWHRVSVQKNRANRYTVFSIQTPDRPGLLTQISNAFSSVQVDVASAHIQTFSDRVENNFFVTKQGFKQPLEEKDINLAMEKVLQALLKVGDPEPSETLWYQTRDGTAVLIAEAIFIDEVNNRELACFKFSKFETPNFRGRLPDAPYRPILLE